MERTLRGVLYDNVGDWCKIWKRRRKHKWPMLLYKITKSGADWRKRPHNCVGDRNCAISLGSDSQWSSMNVAHFKSLRTTTHQISRCVQSSASSKWLENIPMGPPDAILGLTERFNQVTASFSSYFRHFSQNLCLGYISTKSITRCWRLSWR